MEIESVPDLMNGSAGDLDLDALVANCSPDVDKMLMKKPAVPGDTTERIKRRVRRQSSREGLASNGGGCSATHLLGLHHRNNHHHYNQQQPPHQHLHHTAGAISAPGISYFAPQRRWKNSRRSRNGGNGAFNGGGGGLHHSADCRGLPKKGGAGGKGVWGLLGSELLVEEDVCDAQDPNYDSEANDAANTELLELIAVPTPDEFYKLIEPLMLEYYENGDTAEALRSLREVLLANGALGVPHLVVNAAVELSMNHKDSHREMTSLLISDMYGKLLCTADIERGFGMLLDNLDDLVLDTPEAPTWLGNFMARAVADDCIPPRFVFAAAKRENGGAGAVAMAAAAEPEPDLNGSGGGSAGSAGSAGSSSSNGAGAGAGVHTLARVALKRADSLLSLKTTMVHLDNIWGSAGPLRPVKNITKRMTLLLKEFIDSRDVAEAQRCLRALEVPHYHHELVYEAVVMALEAVGGQQAEEAMCALLRAMDEACLVSPAMMEQGFQRVFEDMTDIVIDVPLAYIILDRFIERCQAAGFLTDKIIATMPSRGRKRFVSEGDGGNIKAYVGNFVF